MNFDFHGKQAGKDMAKQVPEYKAEVMPAGSGMWTRLQKFLYYLSHMTQIDDIPEKETDEMFRMLHNSAKTDTFTAEEQAKYIEDMTTEQDIRNQIEYGRFEGREEGRQEGFAEGEAKGRKEGRQEGIGEMVRTMLGKGITAEEISKLTDIAVEDILKMAR